MHTTNPAPIAVGANQYPYGELDLPFNTLKPFDADKLGVLMNTGAVAQPGANAYRHLLAPKPWQLPDMRDTLAGVGDNLPLANPSADLGVGYFWFAPARERAGLTVIRPYMVKYASAAHAAYAASAAANTIGAALSFWTTHGLGQPIQGQPLEFEAEFLGRVSFTNAAVAVGTTTPTVKRLPAAAQYCDIGSVDVDVTLSPGIQIKGNSTGGALEFVFGHQGGHGLIIQASGITASCGVGWLRRYL